MRVVQWMTKPGTRKIVAIAPVAPTKLRNPRTEYQIRTAR